MGLALSLSASPHLAVWKTKKLLEGIGEPEMMRALRSGFWSRRCSSTAPGRVHEAVSISHDCMGIGTLHARRVDASKRLAFQRMVESQSFADGTSVGDAASTKDASLQDDEALDSAGSSPSSSTSSTSSQSLTNGSNDSGTATSEEWAARGRQRVVRELLEAAHKQGTIADKGGLLAGMSELEALLPGPPMFSPNLEAMKAIEWVSERSLHACMQPCKPSPRACAHTCMHAWCCVCDSAVCLGHDHRHRPHASLCAWQTVFLRVFAGPLADQRSAFNQGTNVLWAAHADRRPRYSWTPGRLPIGWLR